MPHVLSQHQLHKVHLTTTWHYIVLVKCKFIIISTQPTSHTLSSLLRHEDTQVNVEEKALIETYQLRMSQLDLWTPLL